jgi:hypothetical protein
MSGSGVNGDIKNWSVLTAFLPARSTTFIRPNLKNGAINIPDG